MYSTETLSRESPKFRFRGKIFHLNLYLTIIFFNQNFSVSKVQNDKKKSQKTIFFEIIRFFNWSMTVIYSSLNDLEYFEVLFDIELFHRWLWELPEKYKRIWSIAYQLRLWDTGRLFCNNFVDWYWNLNPWVS